MKHTHFLYKQYRLNIKLYTLIFLLIQTTQYIEAKTTVEKNGVKWSLKVDGIPFAVKGVTYGGDFNKNTIGKELRDMRFLGVNTVRIWGTNENTKTLLDSANAYGIKVMIGIWMRHGRPGMEGDDSFNYLKDFKGMDEMYSYAIETVKKYKNHPGVLFWGVGNEVYLNLSTDEEKKAYSIFLEKVCKEIKSIDSEHPIVSVEAWNFGLKWWKQYTPSVDIYGINVYGGGADKLPDEFSKEGIDKPYVITEFGVNGEWEAIEDKNGLKIEPSDHQKYDVIAKGYHKWILSKPSCLGVYIFHYEHGKNFGAVWLLMYFDNYFRPSYWATREAFTGNPAPNRIPEIKNFLLPDTNLATGTWIPVALEIHDKDQDSLEVSFHYNQRLGSRTRRDQILPLESRGSLKKGFEIKLPEETGLIKVYCFAKDSFGNLGISQTSFIIQNNGKTKPEIIPGAKVDLPFFVYKDGINDPYVASAFMGDQQNLYVDLQNTEEVKSGKHSLKLKYTNQEGWYGLGLVDPVNDWGDKPGGYNLKGSKVFSFWAKTNLDHVEATVGFGMIKNDKPYYDTDIKSIPITITKEWKKYSIYLTKSDLRCIRTGLLIFSGGLGQPYSIWFDDVKFESFKF